MSNGATFRSGSMDVRPSDLDAEEALLGCVLLVPSRFEELSSKVRGNDFSLKEHENIWNAIHAIIDRGGKVDELTLGKELDILNGVRQSGWRGFLSNLVKSVPNSDNFNEYADIVLKLSTRRNLFDVAERIKKSASDESIDVDDVVVGAEESIFSVKPSYRRPDVVLLRDAASNYYDVVERMVANDNRITGIPTGYLDLDNLIGGFQKSDLIVFAGRPGMGKTSWLLSTALNVARQDVAVAVFTLEMSGEQLVQRLVSMESGLPVQQLRRGALGSSEMVKFVDAIATLSSLPIYIDDTFDITPSSITVRCRRIQSEDNLGLVIVDYTQLMSITGKVNVNREREVAMMSRSLKGLARELGVTVLAASQLNREVERRNDKRPILSDLRESGSIEQDADLVMFLYRDDYYLGEAAPFPGSVELNVAKHRHGPPGLVNLWFDHQTTRFQSAHRAEPASGVEMGDI